MKCILTATLISAALLPASLAAQKPGDKQTGLAAVYSRRLNGRVTASGQLYNPNAYTAANPSLPYGTQVRVTNVRSRRSVNVRINDRGPTQSGRILDLTPVAAQHIGIPANSMRQVELEVLRVGNGHTLRPRPRPRNGY